MDRVEYLQSLNSRGSQLKGNTPVKALNRSEILKVLLLQGPNSRAEIARITGLSAPTVTRITNALLAENLIREDGLAQTKDRGSPPNILSFNGAIGYVVGIDVGESMIQLTLADVSGYILDTAEAPTKAKSGGARTLKQITSGYFELLERNLVAREKILNVCVGVAGMVIPGPDGCIVNAPDIANWWRYPLESRLLEQLGAKSVHIENARNLAVVCERKIGCAKAYKDIVFLNVKAGIGVGLILNGHLYRGSNGAAGEVGFMMPEKNSPPRDKEGHGALEMHIGIQAILRRLGTLPDDFDSSEEIPYLERIYQLAADGNEKYLEVIRDSCGYLGQMIVNLTSVIDPQIVVLGGDIMPLGEMVREIVQDYVQSYCIKPPLIELSTQGNKTCVYGAVQVACDDIYAKLGIW